MRASLWLLVFAVVFLFFAVSSQCLPPITCPKHFRYMNEGSEFFGKLTLFRLPKISIIVDLELTQRELLKSDYVGNLTTVDDLDTIEAKLMNDQPITYRVNFATQTELPKVSRLAVNGIEICHDSEYPKPSETVALQHWFHPSTAIERTKPTLPKGFDMKYKFDTDLKSDVETTTTTEPPLSTAVPQIELLEITAHSEAAAATQPTPIPTLTPTTTTATTTTTTMTTPEPHPQKRQSLQPLANQLPPPALPTPLQSSSNSSNSHCGIVGGLPFIFSGSLLRRGQFPWLTAIYKKHYTATQFICGGTVISTRTVITAAHCFKLLNLTAKEVLVFLGRHNLHDYSEDGIMARDVTALLLHPDYKESAYPDADLALVQLNSLISFGQYIQPICLWSETTEVSAIIGQTAVVAGWGADKSEGSLLSLPRMVETYFIDPPLCLRAGEAFTNLSSPRTICAGSRDGIGPCMGDSGGGLMMRRNGRWVLRGIVSAGQFSEEHCSLREFVMYCDVAKHLSWVRNNMLT